MRGESSERERRRRTRGEDAESKELILPLIRASPCNVHIGPLLLSYSTCSATPPLSQGDAATSQRCSLPLRRARSAAGQSQLARSAGHVAE